MAEVETEVSSIVVVDLKSSDHVTGNDKSIPVFSSPIIFLSDLVSSNNIIHQAKDNTQTYTLEINKIPQFLISEH